MKRAKRKILGAIYLLLAVGTGNMLQLTSFRWYRRAYGGHWERYWVDWPVCSFTWLDVSRCWHDMPEGYRIPLTRGEPLCEDHS